MINAWRYGDDARREDAAAWVVRLEAGDLDDAEAVSFDAWLSASPENGTAFDAALAVSRDYACEAGRVDRALAFRRTRATPVDRRAALGLGAVAAAAVVAVVVAPQFAAPPTESYATAKGERRTVALADGSTIEMNGGAALSVTLGRQGRQVVLHKGQALFDVAHAPNRPFDILAGDRQVRVVGTRFDVRRLEGRLSVTVEHGAVEVRPAAGASGRAYRLRPGQKLDHVEGAERTRVAAADPAEVLAWRTGRLVYRDQPLSVVVADLNQQFATPIRIADPALASATFSGVLILDDQDAVVQRLALLLPIRTVRSDAEVVLRRP
jgi:transmembrane sensor